MSPSNIDYPQITRDERELGVVALSREYPKTFFVDPKRRVPLKKAIEQDIKIDLVRNKGSELRHYDIDCVVEWYCSHVGYHRACSFAGVGRVDLNGMVVAKISAAEARIAGERAAQIFAEIEMRKRQWQHQPQPGLVVAKPTLVYKRALPINQSLNSIEMLAAVEKQIVVVKNLLGDTPEEALRRELARPALQLMIDELNTIIARFDKAAS
ncbi:ProQ/FINO family protein [Bradyrhizobium yuanmingense]|uniref:ProQ/FINO family protein n=1 Tax=Bradyrhizobium yuanmingense TaxID=108015 RepID=UPI0023B9ADA8|nr:ProQ/FINO family protein [Bradyrhizobium yuanmingense]MDF0583304.1 ProQ/FINO family protein [Bradyrhizobium yuanmingense]